MLSEVLAAAQAQSYGAFQMQGYCGRLIWRASQIPGADIGRDDVGVEDTGAAEALAALRILVALLCSCPQLPLQLPQLPAIHEDPVMRFLLSMVVSFIESGS